MPFLRVHNAVWICILLMCIRSEEVEARRAERRVDVVGEEQRGRRARGRADARDLSGVELPPRRHGRVRARLGRRARHDDATRSRCARPPCSRRR